MTHTFKLARRTARFRAPILATCLALALGACDADELTNTTSADPSSPVELTDAAEPIVAVEAPSLASSFSGGIPIGTFAQPTSAFGAHFNGALRNDWPQVLVKGLAAIRARGGKVILMFAGSQQYYRDRSGHFDLGKWKARVDRYKGVNFSSYINNGTVIAHYLIDEPNDPTNWSGRPVSPAVLEEMARYSKQRWPNLPTVVRADPSYLGTNHRYLDAAWAQYLHRRGPANTYIRRVVADAQKRGLGLVVGMNILKGGPNKRPMTASQVKEWGSALLTSSYPCAFISWMYSSKYLAPSGMKDAMRTLRAKAQSRSSRSCRG
jgi:hypothetical protein